MTLDIFYSAPEAISLMKMPPDIACICYMYESRKLGSSGLGTWRITPSIRLALVSVYLAPFVGNGIMMPQMSHGI
jgi:hypothetical protein